MAAEANHVKARRALEKYLHYFERFENHSKSLKMEEELRDKIRKKIDDKVRILKLQNFAENFLF